MKDGGAYIPASCGFAAVMVQISRIKCRQQVYKCNLILAYRVRPPLRHRSNIGCGGLVLSKPGRSVGTSTRPGPAEQAAIPVWS